MPNRIKFVEVRSIARARTFVGMLLLLAAVLTWGIGLTLSTDGKAVVNGTEHVRDTVMTFKHKGAIGTLILCAVAAWLLLPRRWSKWPRRDWAVAVVVALLAGSSLYTLISLPPRAQSGTLDKNLAVANLDADANADAIAPAAQPLDMSVAPAPETSLPPIPRAVPIRQPEQAAPTEQAQPPEMDVPDDRADTESNRGGDAGNEPPSNETDQNEE